MSKKIYRDYFNIDPKYYAAVTADLIKSGEVKWTAFYPHETFVKLLEKTHIMLSGKDSRSLWVEGAYGTGKSHAALTVKSMLEASDNEIRAYFKDYGLKDDLCQQLITDKSNGKLITIHRIGSASIRSDQDLILALQDSITAALQEHGITNRGEASLKESALRWLEDKEANRIYFDSLIQEDKYMWDFGGKHVDEVISVLKSSSDEEAVSKMMRNILKVAEDNGITALRLDIPAMCEWIKSIIEENDISAILFVWDEFTEYFQNNQNALTGFQTLAEISESHPFYFLIVTHESSSLIQDKDMRKKILNRFVGDVTVRIEMPENMAFRLMAQAMKSTSDPVLLPEWENYKADLNSELTSVRNVIITSAKKHSTMGQKTLISDGELRGIVPIHPYAALLLKHMSVAFNSNARSMFDFIISNDMADAKGFKWFINEYGPEDSTYLLTIDMLWDFFTGKDQNGLNDDVRVILDSYGLLKKGSLTPDQDRVFKTALLLEAISLRVNDVELLRPNEQNIDLAFSGTDWSKGKARNIAAGLCQQGLLFEKPVGNGLKEYTVANRDSDIGKINKLKTDIHNSTKTADLIVSADLMSAVQLPVAIRPRFVMEGAASTSLAQVSSKLNGQSKPNRFKAIVTFALNDTEATTIKNAILKAIVQPSNELFYIECLTPMGNDLLSQYVENMAYSKNYAQNDRQRAIGFETQAKKCFTEWKQRISTGAFILYTPDHKSGTRVANLDALQEELQKLNHQIYYCGLEQFNLIDNMFMKGPLAQGAECGIAEELKSTFKSSNVKTSLSTALEGAWKIPNYWDDPAKKSLPIVRIKLEVEKIIKAGFEKASGRISVLSIYEALEEAPYGFMPSNVTAFVMGFALKEYANADYFWSNGSASESMTPEKMKQMIANAINQKFSPSSKYKEEYIVAMSASQRCFLQCTSAVFHIPMGQCGSIEGARDQIRIKMKGLTFPIWCLKHILNTVQLETPIEKVETVIDDYCGIANTANSNKATESDLADQIGTIVHDNAAITQDLEGLLTSEMCRKGMLAYISHPEFRRYYTERKRLLEQLPENLPLVKEYCDKLGRHQKDEVFYLTDSSIQEKYEFVRCLSLYEFMPEEISCATSSMSKQLHLYMQDFVFDTVNTKLPESDSEFRDELTAYFREYKLQKLTNHLFPEFLEKVDAYSMPPRPYNKLQPRSSIISHMDKKNAQCFFFDALGVEYLAFIMAKCEEYALVSEVSVGHCELPSITVKNKEFLQYFADGDWRKIDDLDEMKHHSQVYDYRKCEYPLHLFEELNVIDEQLRIIQSMLVQGSVEKALIISDHGASRLAVRYGHELTSTIELDKSGEHSGRCCPTTEDPNLPFAAYEDGFSVLANYERFKGGRQANVEVHGGATLEEVVVPIITLTKRPANIEICFVNPIITLKPRVTPELILYSNVPLKRPRLLINGDYYDGEFVVDSKHARFEIAKIKRKGNYTAEVFDGEKNMSVKLEFLAQKQTREVDLL